MQDRNGCLEGLWLLIIFSRAALDLAFSDPVFKIALKFVLNPLNQFITEINLNQAKSSKPKKNPQKGAKRPAKKADPQITRNKPANDPQNTARFCAKNPQSKIASTYPVSDCAGGLQPSFGAVRETV